MRFIRLTPADNIGAELFVNPECVVVAKSSELGTTLFLDRGGFLRVLEPCSEVAERLQEALHHEAK